MATNAHEVLKITNGPLGAANALAAVKVGGRACLASGGADGTIWLWDPDRGAAVRQPLTGHSGQVWALAGLDLPGRVALASGGADGTVRIWDLLDGGQLGAPLEGHAGRVLALAAIELEGQLVLASAGDDGAILLRDPTTGMPLGKPLLGHQGQVWALAAMVVSGRTVLASAGEDGTIRLWDLALGSAGPQRTLTGHEGRVLTLIHLIVDDRPVLASGGSDGTVRLWDPERGSTLAEFVGHRGRVLALAALPLGEHSGIASGGSDGTVRLWDPKRGAAAAEPLTGHNGRVLALAALALDDGSVLASAGSDGTIRLLDASRGATLGEPLTGHVGQVWALASLHVNEHLVLAGAGSDGTVRLWDPSNGTPVGVPLTGHIGPVWALATAVAEGRAILVSAGSDGAIRIWDPVDGAPLMRPLLGHSGQVWALAAAIIDGHHVLASAGSGGMIRLWDLTADGATVGEPLLGDSERVLAMTALVIDGRTLLASAGDDGMIRLWDLARDSTALRRTLSGHEGRVLALATLVVDGRQMLASAGSDGAVRMWDLLDDAAGPRITLTGHQGRVLSLATPVVEGQQVLASGGDDGTVRFWDGLRGTPVGDVLPVHSGRVLTITALELGDETLLATGGEDGVINVLPINLDARAGPGHTDAPGFSEHTVGVRDSNDEGDLLGREVLAGHLVGIVGQLLDDPRARMASTTAVIHIDGRWGAGKTSLVRLMVRRLDSAAPGRPERSEPESTTAGWRAIAEARPAALKQRPIVVQYDAWRESSVAPEWWSLATAIHRHVRRSRASATRAYMSLAGVVIRVVKSPATIVAGAFLLVALVTREQGLWEDEALQRVFTVLATVVSLGLLAGRALFWAAPAFGRLHLRAEENPLEGIAQTVAWLRRWSPRDTERQRAADAFLGAIAGISLVWLLDIEWLRPRTEDSISSEISRYGVPLVAAMIAGIASSDAVHVGGAWDRAFRRSRSSTSAESDLQHFGRVQATIGFLVACAVFTAFAIDLPGAHGAPGGPVMVALLVLGCALVLYCVWLYRIVRMPRRPILLVIDDLDRCAAERVVKLLETVHTLLRTDTPARVFPVWRAPAPLVVLVLADGRWVRTAFAEAYQVFSPLGSPLHALGSDFLQKLVDHTVLVPALSASQVQRYVDFVTTTDAEASEEARKRGDPQAPPRDPSSKQDIAVSNANASDPKVAVPSGPSLPPPGDSPILSDAALPTQMSQAAIRQAKAVSFQQADEAEAAASVKAVEATTRHLLTEYAELMPANPRLIKRVANAFGMLIALKAHLAHTETADTVVRAAIALVRFPDLVDDLLTSPEPPRERPEHAGGEGVRTAWARPDVRQVLSGVTLTQVARCYGREYPPEQIDLGGTEPSQDSTPLDSRP